MRSAYLDYAMSVIVGRALPDVHNSLKPVHRRVLFSMSETAWDDPPVPKCASIVGDVIGITTRTATPRSTTRLCAWPRILDALPADQRQGN